MRMCLFLFPTKDSTSSSYFSFEHKQLSQFAVVINFKLNLKSEALTVDCASQTFVRPKKDSEDNGTAVG